ncbi:hypothetical protein QBC38DRAFT_481235 [Podospora fimiseda]|uniref:Potassium channel domain-containing protein n=1 Tax=Podospora fimiseda TaxID=252190 RepID=A0AAN7BMR4_9PEZI|nr:hypothetical protein QBC38DRAFT_481235 [Podospora fimiseda]
MILGFLRLKMSPSPNIPQIRIEDVDAPPTKIQTILGKLRGQSDDLPQRWWFASTAIPLIAACIGPFTNVLSIVSLVSPWRFTLPNNGFPDGTGRGSDDAAVGIPDPNWELIPNSISIVCGFVGHLFLLLNFTRRVRYIVALPLSILFWLISALILIVVEIAMAVYVPPQPPGETYSQGFWYSVLASVLYIIGSGILMINMVGYFKGHYPQKFELDSDQRTLILQTMSFFFWLAGASGVFCALEGFTYADSLYYAQVSVLTIGFGDFAPKTDAGRGFLFVFQFIGIIFLALVISSLTRFVGNISSDKILKQHQVHKRQSTLGRVVSNERELRERLGLPPRLSSDNEPGQVLDTTDYHRRPSVIQMGQLQIVGRTITFDEKTEEKNKKHRHHLLLLEREKDRFEAVRQIQEELIQWKQSWAAGTAILSFLLLWFFGALVFMFTEARISELRYFDCLYFCFVALLTIGYGDLSPKSNLGKPFFVVWSIVAVPIVTVLVQAMSRTVVSAVNRGTFTLADLTIMPKKGAFKNLLKKRRRGASLGSAGNANEEQQNKGKGPEQGNDGVFEQGTTTRWFENIDPGIPPGEAESPSPDDAGGTSNHAATAIQAGLAQNLSKAIKEVARDLSTCPEKKYSFEEWAHFTKLIQFTQPGREEQPEVTGWDWIGEDSPLLADVGEPEWVLERLVESLGRWVGMQEQAKYWDEVFNVMDSGGGRRRSFNGEGQVRISDEEGEARRPGTR